jgi:hypothetical protein
MSALSCLLLTVLPTTPATEPISAIEPMPAPLLSAASAIKPPEDLPELEYTYVELSYLWLDSDDLNDKLDGWDLTGSFELPANFFVQGSIRQQYGDLDFTRYRLGAGWHIGLAGRLDAYGILSYESIDVDGSGGSDDGIGAELGLRMLLTKGFEVNGRFQWIDIDESDAGGGLGARYYLNDRFSLGANIDSVGGDDLITVGVRLEL